MPDSRFYLGRWSDDQQSVQYDPADLTTHAVVIGMTGSGKTGLLIALLEEAARQGLPAIIIDPKGDLTNLLLHFPELRPADFAPWIDPEAARRASQSVDDLAAATAERWRKGLADWGLGSPDLAALKDAVDYTIYTPGSTAGMPVNLLSSFQAPADWQSNLEAQRERIASTVTALLGLIGLTDVDPLRSREHILLANILESAWSQGRSLDLTGLIEQVTTPPFEKLGAFPLERFFPEKDRFELALLLNNFLAAPSFQTWLEGQPLEIESLLHTPGAAAGAGKPRFSIFYLAHLSENERMFFVTLLLASVEGWMRGQRGTSGLRALLAFDEIVGYLPPVANPPSRPVLLRLLKQGRAFGLGLMLATQNPTDLNYKALSNAGTWFIGRLQTEQDKQRLLDGLQSLDNGIDRSAFDQMIGRLGPRLFLLHNVHQPGPRIFQSRWDLNYLAGPLTRAQLPAFKTLAPASAGVANAASAGVANAASAGIANAAPVNSSAPNGPVSPAPKEAVSSAGPLPVVLPAAKPVSAPPSAPAPAKPAVSSANGSPGSADLLDTPPVLPPGLPAVYLPAALSLDRALSNLGGALRGPIERLGMVYKPALLAQAEVRFLNRRYNLDYTQRLTCLAADLDFGRPEWDAYARSPIDPTALLPNPSGASLFRPLPQGWATARNLSALQKDFIDWAFRQSMIYVRANDAFKIYAGPNVAEDEFRRQVNRAMVDGAQAEIDKTAASYDTKLETLRRKIERQQQVVDRRDNEVDRRNEEKNAALLDLGVSLFTGRKRSLSSTLSKRRMTQQAQGELEEAKKILVDLQAEWKDLAAERQQALQRIQAVWQEKAAQVSQVPMSPLKKDVLLERFAIAWLPYYLIKNPEGRLELPAF